MRTIATTNEEYLHTYHFLKDFYNNCEIDEIIRLWTIHNNLTECENDFDFIGRTVCEDILLEKEIDAVVMADEE